jgi:uncharacterized protein (DUF58 family)
MPEQNWLNQRFLERLERLALRWRKSFPGLIGGRNPSRFGGPGMEFLDHRHFHHGDDLRAVNWRAYLRFEKLFLKIFRIEPHAPVRLLLDVSASMQVGKPSKFDYARQLAAALSYVALVRLDAMVLVPFADGLGSVLRCVGGRHRFAPVVEFLSELRPGGRTDFLETARQFVGRFPDRGMLIVISDFLDDADPIKALQHLADFGHELVLLQLWSEQDRVPPWEGRLDLVDAESGAVLELDFDSVARDEYTRTFDAYCDALRRVALANGGRYLGLPTSLDLEEAVFGLLTTAGAVEACSS